ncbi:hypothetical protein FF1_040798 [Malus domestica]
MIFELATQSMLACTPHPFRVNLRGTRQPTGPQTPTCAEAGRKGLVGSWTVPYFLPLYLLRVVSISSPSDGINVNRRLYLRQGGTHAISGRIYEFQFLMYLGWRLRRGIGRDAMVR